MAKVSKKTLRGKKSPVLGNPQIINREDVEDMDLDSRIELIRSLVPLGLMYVNEELDREIVALAGDRYQRKGGDSQHYRHGHNPGSVRLAGQRIPIQVPRVRGSEGEVRLESYDRLHGSRGEVDEELFRRVFYGISCRNYKRAAQSIPGAIGLSSTTVSRQFTEASAAKLKAFQERDLSQWDVVALFLDGKSFAEDMMVLALGVTSKGEKVILGFVQTETENKRVLGQFLQSLMDRGLDISKGILVVIDGGKGLHSAAKSAFRRRVLIQRCQWHKRENVVSYLPKKEQSYWRRRLQKAYERPTYEEAKKKLLEIQAELSQINESAASSLKEGFEETLTLHRLGLFPLLGRSLKTTNCLESVNAMAEERCGKVDYWKNSRQKHRWLASALLDIEPRLRRLVGYIHLPKLRDAIMKKLKIKNCGRSKRKAA
jgi:putative transposase